MKIKNAKSFRKWYKNTVKEIDDNNELYNEDFIGTYHKRDGQKAIKGFFEMFHGDKPDIRGFLRKEVEMAEDGQAIYEFVQNAADCDSTKFYMLYDDNYLVAINNGEVFSEEGIKSILNVGQSAGKQDPDKIGRYGIGFKLVHRLVGKDSGLAELLNDGKEGYRGPILFSWSEKSQFINFIESEEEFEYVDFEDSNAPWLFKILVTNFPVQPNEEVRDLDFEIIKPFEEEELKEFRRFLKSKCDKVDLNSLGSGAVVFLKLGDGKSEYLEKQHNEYLNGLTTSMHFLKSLNTLVINEKVIEKDKNATNILEFIDKNGSSSFEEIGLTETRDKESDAKFKVRFADNPNSAYEIKNSPNIYKYFPAVKEVNKLAFVIHSNLFELSSNRQNLTETSINKKLLELLADHLIAKMKDYKSEDRETFKNLFISILMSEKSTSNFSGNGWQDEFFYNKLLQYICKNIPTNPTKGGYSDNPNNVKINKLKLQLNLADFGLSHIQWFEWDKEEDELLIKEATQKLGIEEWDIRDIVENADLDSINNWIASCDIETYKMFLEELENSNLRDKTKERIRQIKLFKFSNETFYSYNELIKLTPPSFYNGNKLTYSYSNDIIFQTNKITKIYRELINLGIIVSELNIEDFEKISKVFVLPKDTGVYLKIAEKCNTNTLTVEEKKNLFLNFINEETKFDNVAEATLKNLQLFSDSQGNIKSLNKLIDFNYYSTPSWLNTYKIKEEEYNSFDKGELKPYLISDHTAIFKEIYLPNQGVILSELTEPNEIKSLIELYQDNQRQFFNEFIITKNEHSFSIAKKSSDTFQIQSADAEARKFIAENCANNLFVLPYEFLSYKEDDGIIRTIELHKKIIEIVDVNAHKKSLVNIVHYQEAKILFLQKLSEFRFSSEIEYTKDDYEYKILDLACNELDKNGYRRFRDRVVIETGDKNFRLSEISLFSDKIRISNKEFSLSKILPSTYQNSNLISDLISSFAKQGISNEKLNALFGVNEEVDIDNIYKKYSEQSEILENPEQLFFLVYYCQHIRKVNLSKLGFGIDCAVFPSEFALEKEKLPEYLQEWIKNGQTLISELDKIGVFTENSTLVALRKSLLNKSDFDQNKIAQDSSLSDGKMLLNTFELLKEKGIELSNDNKFSVFKEMVRVINSGRKKGQELVIQDEYNFEILEENSTHWKTINDFSIYLYKGALPKIVKLDETHNYVFYRYNDGDFAVNENIIYINEEVQRKETLRIVASEKDNDFSFEDLLQLFDEHTDETERLKQEIAELKQQLVQTNGAILEAESNTDISKNDQEEANREAKELVKQRLEIEGYNFTKGIGDYSTIDVVVKEGKEFLLVIKSYKNTDVPLKVNPNEWIQLMKPNSMFWVHFGDKKLGCLRLYDLLRNKDKLTISFSTENLDKDERLDKFAELLRYFGDVHFDFNSVMPSNVASDLEDYRFNERKTEEDLSSDDESLL